MVLPSRRAVAAKNTPRARRHLAHGSAKCLLRAAALRPSGHRQDAKVFTLQTLPACDPEDQFGDTVGKVAGFSLHAGVAARVNERKKLERLCRYISRPAVSEKRLSLTSGGNIRYPLRPPIVMAPRRRATGRTPRAALGCRFK